jgi:hypothetical protein
MGLFDDDLVVYIQVDHFEEFWQIFPRKVAKVAARQEWRRQKITEALWAQIQETLAWQLPIWARRDPECIPHPRTWLHQQRWMDTPPTTGISSVALTPKMDRRQRNERRSVDRTCPHQPPCGSLTQCEITTALGRRNYHGT